MALVDVSRTITVFQRLCQFAEEYTKEHREALAEALNELFQMDLPDGEPGMDMLAVMDGLIRRLRDTLDRMTLAETELLASFKENNAFRDRRDQLVRELREVFDRGRVECRNHFTRTRADAAGFPARMAEAAGPLLRQIQLVTWTLRRPDFSLGESLIPGSVTTSDSIVQIFEPKAQELEQAVEDSTRRRARARGKQVAKDQVVEEFETTYSLFVNLVKSSFRLAGQNELARWVALNQTRRSGGDDGPPPDGPLPDGPPPDGPPPDGPPPDGPPPDGPPPDDGTPPPSSDVPSSSDVASSGAPVGSASGHTG